MTRRLLHLQEFALPVVKWLITPFDETIGSGKTELLAHAFIEIALEHPEKEVRVRDHFKSKELDRLLLERISLLWNEQYNPGPGGIRLVDLRFSQKRNSITAIQHSSKGTK